jgi:propionyl-CoA carboxylase alpha chain/3-methylcrotonyl-CoA carboxylase alpha subunit
MIAKLIVHADTREAAAARLADACGEVEVWPVKANAGFLKRCLEHPRFVAGDVDTGFIAAEEGALVVSTAPTEAKIAALAVLASDAHHEEEWARGDQRRRSQGPWSPTAGGLYGFRMNGARPAPQRARLNGALIEGWAVPGEHGSYWTVDLGETSGGAYVLTGGVTLFKDGDRDRELSRVVDEPVVFLDGQGWSFEPMVHSPASAAGPASDGALRAPMPGKIVAAPVKPGDAVAKGQPVVVLEAMKMEHALVAPFDGVVETVDVAVGDQVADGTVLAVVGANA